MHFQKLRQNACIFVIKLDDVIMEECNSMGQKSQCGQVEAHRNNSRQETNVYTTSKTSEKKIQ